MIGAVVTGELRRWRPSARSICSSNRHEAYGRTFVRVGVIAGIIAAFLMLFPTGDGQGKNIAFHQPVTLAAMEGLFETEDGAPLAISASPTLEQRRLDNPLIVPQRAQLPDLPALDAEVKGLDRFPAGSLAGQHPAALLQLSHHGGAGHHLHRA